MSLDTIIQVTIDKQTKSVSRAGFGTVLIVGSNPTFGERLKYYTRDDLATLASELTGGTDAIEYKMVSAVFAQSPAPERVAVGREDGGDADMQETLNAIVLEESDFYIICITSTDQTKQEDLSTWVLANKRVAAVRSDDDNIINRTETQDALDTCYLTFDTDLSTGNNIDMTVNGEAMTQVTYATSHLDTMNAIITNLELLTNVTAELDATDSTNRTLKIKKAGATIAITGAAVTGGGAVAIAIKYASIGAVLNASSNDRSGVFYHSDPTTQFPDAAFAGGLAVNFGAPAPGGYTGAYKTLIGVTVTNLTPTQSKNAIDKKVNTYEEVGEVNIVQFGTVSDGDYYDITVLADWTVARIQEGIYSDLVNQPKIPYTEAGMLTIKGKVSTVLDLGISNGGYSDHLFDPVTEERIGGYVVTLPAFSSIPAQDKIDRLLQGVTFEAYLAGAIHKVKIAGTITV